MKCKFLRKINIVEVKVDDHNIEREPIIIMKEKIADDEGGWALGGWVSSNVFNAVLT